MNENEAKKMMQNLDNDLFNKEMEHASGDVPIDFDAVKSKALAKLEAYERDAGNASSHKNLQGQPVTQPTKTHQEETTMKKKRYAPVVAAALIAVIGVSTVYGEELSEFIKSYFNKTSVYETVVDGQAYYLENPVDLGNGSSLDRVVFTSSSFVMDLTYVLDGDKLPPISVKTTNGDTYIPGGYGKDENNGLMLSFFDEKTEGYHFAPTDSFTLTIGENSYDITLSAGDAFADKGDIHPAQASAIHWMNLGYQENGDGIDILASFDDSDLKLRQIGASAIKEYHLSFTNDENGIIGSGTGNDPQPLTALDESGNVYTFSAQDSIGGSPRIHFISNAPYTGKLELTVPAISVGYEKEFAAQSIAIPADNSVGQLNQTIDLGLQQMVLTTIEKTSDTTATLTFQTNTGTKKEVQITDPGFYSSQLKAGSFQTALGSDTATFDITFEPDTQSFDLTASWPRFIVNGNWEMEVGER